MLAPAFSWSGPWTVFDKPFQLDWPWMVPVAVVLTAATIGLRVWHRRRRAARLARLGSAVAQGVRQGYERARTLCLTGAVLLCALSLAGPRWGVDASRALSRGLDVVLAVDASTSMLATDDRPTRLERVKQEVRRLRALAPADRVALIAFAGRSYILTPLTTDDGALDLFLENLDPSVVGQPGSAVARAIRQGVELLTASASDGADRALVVLSDGEFFEPEADMVREAQNAAAQRVALVTVGFGTTRGSSIPITDDGLVREKRDDAGRVIITTYAPAALTALAQAGGGTFVPAETSDKAAAIRQALGALRRSTRVLDTRAGLVPRYHWLLVPALLLLALEAWFAHRAAPRERTTPVRDAPGQGAGTATPIATRAAAALLALVVGGCAVSPSRDPVALWNAREYGAIAREARARLSRGDGSSEVRYNLGTALLASDSLETALEPLELAESRLRTLGRGASADSLLGRTRFNTGLAHLLRGRRLEQSASGDPSAGAAFDAALASYRAYLIDHPDDAQAKWNYELALRRKPPQSGGGGGGGGGGASDEASPPPPPGEIDPSQADALLNSASREERAVQGRRPKAPRGAPPPGGKDW
ncbi:MAG: VWA domain-containing protein [Gemmatimonadaceae bacterium]|nr:VWA domain-containing protein [Gemmatimonadaceae bacterium]